MASLSTKCATAATVLTLFSPTVTELTEQYLTLPTDFLTATGYIRKEVTGSRLHGVDWDGVSGVETVVRENGHRTQGFWKEWREWCAKSPGADLETHGNRVCELVLRHFGPYDNQTAETLSQRRKLQQQRASVLKTLNTSCPLSLRNAAWEYLGGPLAPLTLIPPTAGESSEDTMISSTIPRSCALEGLTISHSPLSRGELILRAHAEVNPDLRWQKATSLEEVANNILKSAQPFEKTLDEIDEALLKTPLPSIPGEGSPADIDLIPYGRLICRHRAVIAAIPLALAGFNVELVRGAIEVGSAQEPHLFIYCEERGILEASSHGPVFWKRVTSSSESPSLPVFYTEEGSIYRVYQRTKLTEGHSQSVVRDAAAGSCK
jgi:hypothetical protein